MRELSDVLAGQDISLARILLTIQVAAARAGNGELATWAAREASGYGDRDELPAYRIWDLEIEATLQLGLRAERVQVPHIWFPEGKREAITTYPCRIGMEGIHRALNASEGANDSLTVPHPNLVVAIQQYAPLHEGVLCTAAAAKFPIGHLADVATRVRQAALTWSLKCEENGEGMKWPEDRQEEQAERTRWKERVKEQATLEAVRGVFKGAWEFAKAHWLM